MPDHDAIYQSEADRYDRLISREDWEGNLSVAMERVRPADGLDIVELGAGTGRLTRLLVSSARRIVAFDAAAAMLDAAHDRLAAEGTIDRVALHVADHRSASVPPGSADLIIETLGTGVESPAPPGRLIPYYDALTAAGFDATSIRTDYRFASVEEAESLARFFFGDTLADRVAAENLTTLPECTGLWWRHGHRDG